MKVKGKVRKKIISCTGAIVIAMSLCSIPQMTAAAEYTGIKYDDNLYYLKIDKDKDDTYDYVVITGCEKTAVSVDIPSEINGLPVTRIGEGAFSLTEKLESVSIPDTVTAIEGTAFLGAGIKNITLPDSIKEIDSQAFCGTNLTSVDIPDSVETLGDGIFQGCYKLKTVNLGKNVENIGSGAFEDCSSLESIKIPDSVNYIGYGAFKGTPITDNQNGIKYADTWVVEADKNSASIEIKDGTKGIAERTFSEYSGLEEVAFPDSLEYICKYAFLDCPDIQEISTGDGLKVLNEEAFSGCTKLKSFTMGENVATINENVFSGCTKLEDITFKSPSSIVNIFGNAFSGTPWLAAKQEENPFVVINSILIDGTAAIPDTDKMEALGHYTLTIPDNVKTIGSYAFTTMKGFSKLASVDFILPENVVKIEEGGFYCCYPLNNITIKNPDCEIVDDGFVHWMKSEKYGAPDAWKENYGGTICFTASMGEYFHYGNIIGHDNSTAQAYAKKIDYNFISLDSESTETTATTEVSTTEPETTYTTSVTEPTEITTTITEKTETTATTEVSTPEPETTYTTSVTEPTEITTTITEKTETTTTKVTEITTISTTKATTSIPITTTITTTATKTISVGDMNGDSKIDSKDAVLVLKSYAESLVNSNATVDLAGDINGDKKVDSKDAVLILKYYAATLTGFTGTISEFNK